MHSLCAIHFSEKITVYWIFAIRLGLFELFIEVIKGESAFSVTSTLHLPINNIDYQKMIHHGSYR